MSPHPESVPGAGQYPTMRAMKPQGWICERPTPGAIQPAPGLPIRYLGASPPGPVGQPACASPLVNVRQCRVQ